MPLNLDQIASFAEAYTMLDACTITRKATGADPIIANWNETTGGYSPSRVSTSTVYTGKCMVYTRQPQANPSTQGGVTVAEEAFYLSLPRNMAGARIKIEDIVTITTSQDARLVSSTFCVEAVDEGTHLATRELRMSRYTEMVV